MILKTTTEWRGKFRHTFVHDNDFDLEQIRKIKVGPGPYHQNRLIKAMRNGIVSPYYDGSYEEFLKTKEWRETRDEVIEMNEGKCWRCEKRKAVHVHHVTYEFGWLPFPFDTETPTGFITQPLIPVCNTCHAIIHIIDGAIK